jgi:DNA-binding SARP family transcriptional activator
VTLGRFRVERDGAPVSDAAFGRRSARVLLAVLLSHRGVAVHRDALVEWLWPELGDGRGLRCLQTAAWSARRALDPVGDAGHSIVVADGETYRLELDGEDSWDAAALLDGARAALAPGAPVGAVRRAAEAVVAPYLPEWASEEWAATMRAEVQAAAEAVLQEAAERAIADAGAEFAIAAFRRLVALEPIRERWSRGLMRAYALAGEPGLAIRAFHALRSRLVDELGIEPSAETRGLAGSVLRAA